MTLEEWTATDKATREKLEVECYQRGTPRQIGELADEAAKVFAKELADQPQVTAVVAGEDNTTRRSILMVTTSLRTGEKLPEIPEEFAGFPVVQYGVADKKNGYLQRLEFVLRAMSFPQAEVETWLNRFDDELSNIGSVYYAHTPEWWFAETLVPAVVKGRLVGEPMLQLRDELRGILTGFFKEADPVCIGLEPAAMSRLRGNLQKVFGNYGVNL